MTLFDRMNSLGNTSELPADVRARNTMLVEAKNITDLLRSVTLSYAEKAEALGGIDVLLAGFCDDPDPQKSDRVTLRKLITLLYFAWIRSSQYPFPQSLLSALLTEAEMVVVTDPSLSETPGGDA